MCINNKKLAEQESTPLASSLILELCFIKLDEDINVCVCDVHVQKWNSAELQSSHLQTAQIFITQKWVVFQPYLHDDDCESSHWYVA